MPSSRRPARPSGAARGSGARPSSTPRGGSGAGTSGARSTKGTAPAPTGRTAPKKSSGSAPRSGRPAPGGGAKRPTQPRRRTTTGSVPPPTRPTRTGRRRGSLGLALPEVLTVRAMVLSVVVLLAVVLLLPTMRAVVTQQAELRELRSELSEQQVQKADLETELARWDDRSYVIEQARSRLRFVMPGDKVWRPLEMDSVQKEEPAPGVVGPSPGTPQGPSAPWYTSVWDSVQVAGGDE